MIYPRALSMMGVNMNAAIKKAVQDAVNKGETEKAQRIVLDVLGSAFAAGAAQQVIRVEDEPGDDLKACPFCGSTDLEVFDFDEYLASAILCKYCETLGPRDNSPNFKSRVWFASQAWNRRV